jgi:predicted transcriptional regulator
MSNANGDKLINVGFRMSPEIDQRLNELSTYHGRSKSEEVRLAIAVHDARSTLSYLKTPEGRAELGDGVRDAIRTVERDLRDLERATYRPRPPLPTPTLN